MMKKRIYLFYAAVFVMVFFQFSGCTSTKHVAITSKRYAGQDFNRITDIEHHDWGYYDKKTGMAIDIYNDDRNLYLYVSIKDGELIDNIIRQGLSIWFNQNGNEDKDLGLNLPSALPAMRPDGHGTPPPGEPQAAPPTGEMELVKTVRIITSTDGSNRITIQSREDIRESGIIIDAAMDPAAGLIYEITIPLEKSETTPYAVFQTDRISNTFGIGFIINSPSNRNRPGEAASSSVNGWESKAEGAGAPSGGPSGEMGPPPGNGGGGPTGERPSPENNNSECGIWATVKLSL